MVESNQDNEGRPTGEGWTLADVADAEAAQYRELFRRYFLRHKIVIYVLVAAGWAVVFYWWVFAGAEMFRR
jgi:hypothetical protein